MSPRGGRAIGPRARAWGLGIALGLLAAPAGAAPRQDPARPPDDVTRVPRAVPAASGAALDRLAEQRLKAIFDAADRAHQGTLTRDQAAAGFGFVAVHFEAIDAAHRGRVTFDDVRRYLAARRGGGVR